MFSAQPQHKLATTTLPKITDLSTKTHTFFAKKNLNRTEFSAEHTYSQPNKSKQNGVSSTKKTVFSPRNSKQNEVFSQKHKLLYNTTQTERSSQPKTHICLITTFQTERNFQQNTPIFNHKVPNRAKFSTKNMYFQPQNSKQNGIFGQTTRIFNHNIQNRTKFSTKNTSFVTGKQTQSAPGLDTEHRYTAPGPATESAGQRHRAPIHSAGPRRISPIQSAGPRHRERRSNQHDITQCAIRQKTLATIQPMHFCPYCLGSVPVCFFFSLSLSISLLYQEGSYE